MPKLFNDKPRIAMLGHKRVPSREGGVEIVVEELSTRMVKRGFEVTCYNRKGHHVSGTDFDKVIPIEHNGIRLKNVFTIDKRGLAAMTASVSAAICTTFGKYDIVHFHAEGSCAMIWLPKLFGKKCIATIHGLDHQRVKWSKFAKWYILFGEKCAVKFADEIIVLSENVKNYFLDTYGRETIFIPNGVNSPEIIPADTIIEKFSLKKDDYILFLGRLVPEKGIHYLIEAFKNVKTDKKLVIAGGCSDTNEYVEEIKALAGENSNIIFTDFVSGKTLEELYSNAYIYVLPSDLEGMPLSLLEAMSYGNCCLTSDIPECADVIGDFGVTFKKQNIVDLMEKLQQLCDNSKLVEYYKENASDYICDKYSWDDVVNKTLMLYGVFTDSENTGLENKNENLNYK